MSHLIRIGPLLRYVGETTATIWMETAGAATVAVLVADRRWETATFAVHGHHFALVEIDGLEPGSVNPYLVDVDGEPAWPLPDSDLPPSRIATIGPDRNLRMAFGSCRMSLPHDEKTNHEHGVDALQAYAQNMVRTDPESWPDLVLFLGDQVYADETSDEMQKFIAARRDIHEPPCSEVKDFEEYTHLYFLAWTEPTIRWLLSTLPSAMIFDDHDVRDDWNTSAQWRRDMAQEPWWHDRIVGGLTSYWIYQHLGNISPAERAKDELWSRIASGVAARDDRDWGDVLDAFAELADEQPTSYRWSYSRDVGRNRVVVVDSRAGRVLQPDKRSIIDDQEMAWLDEQMQGGFDHVFVGTSLPFLLPRGLHFFEAWNEAVSSGAWGSRAAVLGERLRRSVDMEHWAAFHEGFRKVAAMAADLAAGKRGDAPASVIFLSGDVHHSYIGEASIAGPGRLIQAVCSPIRNPLPRTVAVGLAVLGRGATPLTRSLARLAKVSMPAFEWRITHGPWYDNNLATLETSGRQLSMKWEAGEAGGAKDPELKVVADFTL